MAEEMLGQTHISTCLLGESSWSCKKPQWNMRPKTSPCTNSAPTLWIKLIPTTYRQKQKNPLIYRKFTQPYSWVGFDTFPMVRSSNHIFSSNFGWKTSLLKLCNMLLQDSYHFVQRGWNMTFKKTLEDSRMFFLPSKQSPNSSLTLR